MYTAVVWSILFSVLVIYAAFLGCWLTTAGLFPKFVARASATYTRRPVVATLVGIVAFVLLGVIASVLANNPFPPLKITGIGLYFTMIILGLAGLTGLAQRIGTGLKSARDEHDPWRVTLRGGAVLGLTFMLPFIGTFLILPWAILSGFGVFILAAFRREAQPAPVATPVPTPAMPLPQPAASTELPPPVSPAPAQSTLA